MRLGFEELLIGSLRLTYAVRKPPTDDQ